MTTAFSLTTDIAIGWTFVAVLVALLWALYRNSCRHEWHRRFDSTERRMFLACTRCNKETPGWQIDKRGDKGAA